LSEATAKAADVAATLAPSAERDPVLRETGYSTLPCARVSRLKFRCGLVVFYENAPNRNGAIIVRRTSDGRIVTSGHFAASPRVRTLTVEEANAYAVDVAGDYMYTSSTYVGPRKTGYSLSPCARKSRIRFRCRMTVSFDSVPSCKGAIIVRRIRGGRLYGRGDFGPRCSQLLTD